MMRTRRVSLTVMPVINKGRRGGARNTMWYLNASRQTGNDRVIDLDIDMPVRDRHGQRVSRDYMHDLVEFPDTPGNLLYEKIRQALVEELGMDWDEYGMTFEIHTTVSTPTVSTPLIGDLIGRVNFLHVEPDDEADWSSTATELNLDDLTVDDLAQFLLEIVKDSGGAFLDNDLRQVANSDDTSGRVRAALGILEYSALDHSFGDRALYDSIELQDFQVPTSVEGQTTSLSWERMSDGDKAGVIAAIGFHLQEESSFWTYTDQRHMAAEVARADDTVEDYVERQIRIWSGVWVDGTKAFSYRDMMYRPEDRDMVEQNLREHLMERYGRSDPNRENNNPEVWFRNRQTNIRNLIRGAIDESDLVSIHPKYCVSLET